MAHKKVVSLGQLFTVRRQVGVKMPQANTLLDSIQGQSIYCIKCGMSNVIILFFVHFFIRVCSRRGVGWDVQCKNDGSDDGGDDGGGKVTKVKMKEL